MGLLSEYAKGTTMVVEVTPDNKRIAAAIVVTRDRVVFADVYWEDADFHPFHVLESDGERTLTGDPPWKVGKSIIRPLVPFSDADANLVSESVTWRKFQERDEGRSDQDKAKAALRQWIALELHEFVPRVVPAR